MVKKILVLKKTDLTLEGRRIPIEEVGIYHVAFSLKEVQESDAVIYIDNGRNKMLKDRFYGIRL